MTNRQKADFAVIILAAGQGQRMKSSLSKVLHEISGKPILVRTVDVIKKVNPLQKIIVVNSKNFNLVKKIIFPKVTYAIQKSPLGTADAIRAGLEKAKKQISTVAVMYGDDTAFYKPQTIKEIFKYHQRKKAVITFVTLKLEDPTGVGRIIRRNGKLVKFVEEKDATEEEKKVNEVNDGLYFFNTKWLTQNISKVKPSPVTGEFYVNFLIDLAIKNHQKVETYKLKDSNEWQSINTRCDLAKANLKFQKRIHIMGLAGAGASAAAKIAQGYGYEVTGCDQNPNSSYTQNLNLEITKGHNPSHLTNISKLIVSPAVLKFDSQNEEVQEAKKFKIPIYTWQEFQGQFLQKNKFVIAVAGGYGKSTTTAMISQILIDAKLNPTCEMGAKVISWGTNFKVGKSKYYICEADEYNDNFLNYYPNIAMILNLGWDHPDYFKNKDQLLKSYGKFIKNIKKNGFLIISDSAKEKLKNFIRNDIKIIKISDFGKISLSLIGDFKKENANAALTASKCLNLDIQKAKDSLSNFEGLSRRLELKGNIGKTKVFDDYAVQPYTIETTINALRQKFPDKKILLVFEPHTFSRIRTFFDNFAQSLQKSKVNKILITEVFAAREKGQDKNELAKKLATFVGPKACYSGSIAQTAKDIKEKFRDFDIICSMGAGDVYKMYDFLKNA